VTMGNAYNKNSQLLKKPPVCRAVPPGPAPEELAEWSPRIPEVGPSLVALISLVAYSPNVPRAPAIGVVYWAEAGLLSGPAIITNGVSANVTYTAPPGEGAYNFRAICTFSDGKQATAWGLAVVRA